MWSFEKAAHGGKASTIGGNPLETMTPRCSERCCAGRVAVRTAKTSCSDIGLVYLRLSSSQVRRPLEHPFYFSSFDLIDLESTRGAAALLTHRSPSKWFRRCPLAPMLAGLLIDMRCRGPAEDFRSRFRAEA